MSFTVTSLVGGNNGGSSLFDYKTPGTTQASALSDFIVNPNIPEGGDVYNTIQAAMDAACAAGASETNPVIIIVAAGQYTENVIVPCNGIFLNGLYDRNRGAELGIKSNPVEIVGNFTCSVSGPFNASNIIFTGVVLLNNSTPSIITPTNPAELASKQRYTFINCSIRLSSNFYGSPTLPDFPTSPHCLQVLDQSNVVLQNCSVSSTQPSNSILQNTAPPGAGAGLNVIGNSVISPVDLQGGFFSQTGGFLIGPIIQSSDDASIQLRNVRLSGLAGTGPPLQLVSGLSGNDVRLNDCTIVVASSVDPNNWASGPSGNTITYNNCGFEAFSSTGVTGGISLRTTVDLKSEPLLGRYVVAPGQAGENIYQTIQEAVEAAGAPGVASNQVVTIVDGVYNEDVDVTTDNLTIRGTTPQGSGGGDQGVVINGRVRVSAGNLKLNSLKIVGSNDQPALEISTAVTIGTTYVRYCTLENTTSMTTVPTVSCLPTSFNTVQFYRSVVVGPVGVAGSQLINLNTHTVLSALESDFFFGRILGVSSSGSIVPQLQHCRTQCNFEFDNSLGGGLTVLQCLNCDLTNDSQNNTAPLVTTSSSGGFPCIVNLQNCSIFQQAGAAWLVASTGDVTINTGDCSFRAGSVSTPNLSTGTITVAQLNRLPSAPYMVTRSYSGSDTISAESQLAVQSPSGGADVLTLPDPTSVGLQDGTQITLFKDAPVGGLSLATAGGATFNNAQIPSPLAVPNNTVFILVYYAAGNTWIVKT